MATTMPVHPPVTSAPIPPAGVSTNPSDPNYNPIYDPASPYYGQVSGPVGSTQHAATSASVTPPTAATPSGALTWTGDFNIPAMLAAAGPIRGGLPNDDPAYWENLKNDFTQRYGSGAANEMYQRMLGKEAGGSDAAQQGPYSAANGYTYTPSTSTSTGGSSLSLTNGLQNASALSGMNLGVGPSLVPTDTNAYQTLLGRIKSLLGGDASFEREALLDLGSSAPSSTIGTTPTSVTPTTGTPSASSSTPAVQPVAATPPTPPVTDTGAAQPPETSAPPSTPSKLYGSGGPSESDALRSLAGSGAGQQEQIWSRAPWQGPENATAIPDWLGNAILAPFPGVAMAAKAGTWLNGKLNQPGETPVNPDQGPTDPNLTPERFDSALQARNAAIAQQALNQNEVNGGI